MPLSLWVHPTLNIERLYVNNIPLACGGTSGTDAAKVWFEEGPEGSAVISFKGLTLTSMRDIDAVTQCVREHLHPADITSWCSLKALLEPQMIGPSRAHEAENLNPLSVKLTRRILISANKQKHPTIVRLLSQNEMIELAANDNNVGDFEVLDKAGNRLIIVVERCNNKNDIDVKKTDFEYSVQDTGAIFDNAEKLDFAMSYADEELSSALTIAVMVLEGDVYGCSTSSLIQQVDGAISFLVAAQRLSVISTYNCHHSAALIARLSAAFTEGSSHQRLNGTKKPKALECQRAFVIESLPGISKITARALLKTFGTMKAIVNASETELRAVNGIGPRRARTIKRVLCGEI